MSDQTEVVDEVDNEPDYMAAGFSGKEVATTEDLTPAPAPAVAEVPVIKYAQITEDQFQNLLSKATAFDESKAETKKQFESAFGTIGNLKQVITQLQAGTQKGKQVELTAEDVAEISNQYPDLGESTLKVLQRVAGKLNGTGAAFDDARVDQRVMQHLTPQVANIKNDVRNEIAAEDLAETYPNWREIVGPKDSDSEFRKWLKAQPDGYGDKVLASSRAKVIADSIGKFEASKKPAATAPKPVDKRSGRFAEAVTPRGTGGHGEAAPNTEDAAMSAGFKSFRPV